jgi:hypothetical protein
MMMLRVLLAVLVFGYSAALQAAQVSQVEVSSLSPAQMVQMMDQRYEPIYEDQPYVGTCNREVLDHMEAVCSTVSDTVCHGVDRQVCETVSDQVCNSQGCVTVPRRVCHQEQRVCEVVPRRVCHDRAVMRTEFYSCTKYRSVVVGQRLVKTFEHLVEVLVDRPELLQGQKLNISLLARESSVAPTLVSSFSSNLLTVESIKVSDQDSGVHEMINTRILVHVDASTELLSKILSGSIQDLQLSKSGISMKINGVNELSQSLSLGLKLTQHRAIINDKTLFNDSLSLSGLSVVTEGASMRVSIPLSQLNVEQLKSKKHNLSASISLKYPNLAVLNTNDMATILNKRLESALSNIIP